jgi:hypothetical protein
MLAIASTPGALRLFAVSIVARLPVATLSIGLLVHARHLTGSFMTAGIVAGAFAIALGAGGPVLGALVDRRGQTAVLVASAIGAGVALGAAAALPAGASLPALVALAAAAGLANPPVEACTRTLIPALIDDAEAIRAAYAAESATVELTWIAGPPLVLLAGAMWSTGIALAGAAAVLVAGTVAFAAQPVSRAWRPAPTAAPRPRGGSLATPAMRTLAVVFVLAGVLFGAAEIGITAAAEALGATAAAGPLLGIWGAGSLVGGLVATRAGGGARSGAGLALMLAALGAGHLALAGASGSVLALAAVLALAGTTIAPTFATVFAMVDHAAPAGTATEAFAWLNTAQAVGAAVGAAIAGAVVQGGGPAGTFALAGAAGIAAALIAAARAGTITRSAAPVAVSAAA